MKNNVRLIRSAVGSLASIGFINFLKENNVNIIGVDINENNVGKFFVDKYYTIFSSNSENEKKLINQLSLIVEKEKINFILSGPETEILLLQKNKQTFQKLNCEIFHSDYETLCIISNKESLYVYLKDIVNFVGDFHCLSKYSPEFIDSAKIIIKPKFGRGGADIHIIDNKIDEIRKFKKKIISNQYLVQKVFQGREYSVDILCDMQGKILNIVCRIRQKTESGVAVISETFMNKTLIEYVIKINEIFKLKGFSCIQFIEHDGKYYLTDINPRFGGGAILSLKSSVVMQKNLINLLSGYNDKLIYNCIDFQHMKMHRYYKEHFIEL